MIRNFFLPRVFVSKGNIFIKGWINSDQINAKDIQIIRIYQWDAITFDEITIEVISNNSSKNFYESKFDLKNIFDELEKLSLDISCSHDSALKFLKNNGDSLLLYQKANH